MELFRFIFLCFLLFGYTSVLYGQAPSLMALSDSTMAIKPELKYKGEEEKKFSLKQVNPKEELYFQLDTDQTGKPIVLLHLKDTVDMLIISAHNFMGSSQEIICEPKLSQGFYEFTLPKVPHESLKYWQISMDGQRVISFIR